MEHALIVTSPGLDDLCVRFIINLPQEELESVERICFQVEEAQWFYEDFIRPLDPDLPSLNLRNFCLRIFQHCPLLSQFSSYHHSTAFSEFLAYKTRVPVRGAIMLNHDMDAVVLVKGWKKGANWSFPRGKINKDEPDLGCAIREVYEETGYDIHEAGLVTNNEDVKFIEITMREQHMRLYVFRDVPMESYFEPKTRKEISKVQWYKLSDLPTLKKGRNQQEGKGDDLANNANKFYMVAPFLNPLKKWITQQKKLDKQKENGQAQMTVSSITHDPDELLAASQTAAPVPNNHVNEMERLLTGLRQSGQIAGRASTSELTEPFPVIIKASISTAPPVQPLFEPSQPSFKRPTVPTASVVGRRKSDALLALLKGEAVAGQAQVPQTPMEQIIEHPAMPPSPKHHHAPSERDRVPTIMSPTKPPSDHVVPTGVLPQPLNQPTTILAPQGNHTSSKLSSKQPFNPSSSAPPLQQPYPPQVTKPRTAQADPITLAPYHRLGDRTVAQASHTSGIPSLIPAANKLPPPKLTSHSSALLNLFRSEQRLEAPSTTPVRVPESVESPKPVTQGPTTYADNGGQSSGDGVSAAAGHRLPPNSLTSTIRMPGMTNKTDLRPGMSESDPNKLTTNPELFIPPKQEEAYASDLKVQAAMAALHLSPSAAPTSVDGSTPSRTTHQAALLDLFRKPSSPPAEVSKAAKPSLEPPPIPFELSALPSPGHSREPSGVTQPPQVRPMGDQSHVLPMSQPKHTKAVLAPRKSPVSATVNGPLNVPQFDMLLKKPSENASIAQNGVSKDTPKLPLRILSRSAQYQSPSVSAPKSTQTDIMTAAPPDVNLSTPPPPVEITPKAQQQPQTLRRPPHLKPSEVDSILSPIEPLPSPKHSLGSGKQAQYQKQSLLSLFNTPPPVMRPTAVGPEALVSPPPFGSASQFSFEEGKKQIREAIPLAGLERKRMNSLASTVGEGGGSMSSGRQTPRTITTPSERSFLLGYLEGVARGEKR